MYERAPCVLSTFVRTCSYTQTNEITSNYGCFHLLAIQQTHVLVGLVTKHIIQFHVYTRRRKKAVAWMGKFVEFNKSQRKESIFLIQHNFFPNNLTLNHKRFRLFIEQLILNFKRKYIHTFFVNCYLIFFLKGKIICFQNNSFNANYFYLDIMIPLESRFNSLLY